MVARSALAALLALAAVPVSHAAVCSMDIDGNGRLEATTDGLLMTRYLLGLRGAALVTGALGTGATRTLYRLTLRATSPRPAHKPAGSVRAWVA